jgi:hypothetical protein
MNPKERMRRAIHYEAVDRLPTQINYTAGMGARLAQHFGVTGEDLPARLGNHMLRVDISTPPRLSDDGRLRYDWWGAGHDTQEEGYFVAYSPLRENPDLDAFDWPDADAPGLLDDAANAAAKFLSRPTSVSRCSSAPGRCAGSTACSWICPPIPATPPNCSTASPRSSSC